MLRNVNLLRFIKNYKEYCTISIIGYFKWCSIKCHIKENTDFSYVLTDFQFGATTE